MRISLVVLALFSSLPLLGQQGYDLQFRIKGLRDTTVWLGYYYGESTYRRDTAVVDGNGEFRFKGSEVLPQGIYLVALHKTRLLEFAVGNDQQFKLETDTAGYIENMKVTGDTDNTIFYENMRFNKARHDEAQPFMSVIQDSTASEEEKKAAREKLEAVNASVAAYHEKIVREHPGTVTSKIFLATQPLKAPDPPTLANGSIDSTFQLRWYREHFFDNFDLADDALIRMPKPFYRDKVYEYLDKLYAPNPDTVIRAIEFMVDKAKKNPETYKYLIFQCVLKYQNPDIMGLDAVFVYLNDTYFANGEMDFWANDQMKKNMQQHADRLRKSLLGNTGPNLIMQDVNFKPKALYDIKSKYTVIYFFDPDCSHCRQETPKLVDFYERNKTRFDVEVFAVSSDTSMAKMANYIKEMGMKWITVNGPRTYVGPYQDLYDSVQYPTVYVLDDKKKIIAKKIPVEKIEEFLAHYEKRQKAGQL